MNTEADIFYKAMLARDYRFDGKFFVGVKTTGIYCRPICPAKPKRQNVIFFATAQAAEKGGYRPCLRCCPESAPLSPAWIGKNAIVNRALRYIASGEYSELKEEEFSAKFGVSSRHLRRLFREEMGLTPKQIFYIHRLNFARKLVMETYLPITEIAFVSHFSSVRQFNTSFKKRFSKSPTQMRQNKKSTHDAQIKLLLSYRPPFDWNSLMQFYKGHEIFGIDSVTDNSYSRAFEIDGLLGQFRLSHLEKKNSLLLEVDGDVTKILYRIAHNVREMFDLNSDPLLIANTFEPCQIMHAIYQKYPGMRIPRCWNAFETAISTILGQMVSTEQGRNLIQQLVINYGKKVSFHTKENIYLFPSPDILAQSNLDKIKTTKARKETIKEFSRLIHEEKISLLPTQDPNIFKQNLLKIKGIGPWTAEYISLRALGDTNAFPDKDLILKRVVEKYPMINIDSFAPWKSYAAIYLWKEFAQSMSSKKTEKK